jgi:hypothetical protein
MPPEIIARRGRNMTEKQIVEAVARGWCHQDTSKTEFDADLALAIIDEIVAAQKKDQAAQVDNISKAQLLDEMDALVDTIGIEMGLGNKRAHEIIKQLRLC